MERDRNYLIDMYNATSTEDPIGSDELETYEAWLERQLLSRIEKIDKIDVLKEWTPSENLEQKIASLINDECSAFKTDYESIKTTLMVNFSDSGRGETKILPDDARKTMTGLGMLCKVMEQLVALDINRIALISCIEQMHEDGKTDREIIEHLLKKF